MDRRRIQIIAEIKTLSHVWLKHEYWYWSQCSMETRGNHCVKFKVHNILTLFYATKQKNDTSMKARYVWFSEIRSHFKFLTIVEQANKKLHEVILQYTQVWASSWLLITSSVHYMWPSLTKPDLCHKKCFLSYWYVCVKHEKTYNLIYRTFLYVVALRR